MATARENAINLYTNGIRDGHAREAVTALTGDRYTQHSTGVRDGVEGFVAFFEPFIARNPTRDIRIVRALQDGRHIFVHAFQSLNDGESEWVTTDFFDSDRDGKIIEHWDVIAAYEPANPAGHSTIDGETDIRDLLLTADNKALVGTFVDECLIARRIDRMPEFINPDTYIQHSHDVGDGLAAFLKHFAPPDCPLSYQECFLLVGEGNFVATLSRARWENQDLCQADIFRIDNGRIVEHWDCSEPVPPREEWVNSGKF